MKRLIVLLLAVLLLVAGCTPAAQLPPVSSPEIPTEPVVELSLDKQEMILMTGGKKQLQALLSDSAYTIEWQSDTPSVALVDADGTVSAINAGYARITASVKDMAITATCEVTVRSGYMLDVPFIAQNPAFPTGCESVSATMALQYYGIEITPAQFIDNCLTRGPALYTDETGKRRGPSPYDCFIGDPRKKTGFGCYAPVIDKAVDKALADTALQAVMLSNLTVEDLCTEYINHGVPVIFWATMWMREPYSGARWYLEDGAEFVWTAPEHCLVLVGYDGAYYYFNDPLESKQVRYARTAVDRAYDGLGRQAVVILPKV